MTGLEIDRGTIRLVRWLDDEGDARPKCLAQARLADLLAAIGRD